MPAKKKGSRKLCKLIKYGLKDEKEAPEFYRRVIRALPKGSGKEKKRFKGVICDEKRHHSYLVPLKRKYRC
jgi:rubrerythrin